MVVPSNYLLEARGQVHIKPSSLATGFVFQRARFNNVRLFASVNNDGLLGSAFNRFRSVYTFELNATRLVTNSDMAIKENIQPIKSASERLMKVRPVTYDLNERNYEGSDPKEIKQLLASGRNQYGVIAQELQKVFPELVHQDSESKLLAVNYVSLVPILVQAIQDQQKTIDNLNARLRRLEGK